MRLFLIAFALSSLATFSHGQDPGPNNENSGWQPMRSSRFDTTATQDYLMRRAREDSEYRRSMLRYYESIGFTYGSPLINGDSYFNLQASNRNRRLFWGSRSFPANPYGSW